MLERRFRDDEDTVQWLEGVMRDSEDFEALDAPNVKLCIPKKWLDGTCVRMDCETREDLQWVENGYEGGVNEFVECLRLWVENRS